MSDRDHRHPNDGGESGRPAAALVRAVARLGYPRILTSYRLMLGRGAW